MTLPHMLMLYTTEQRESSFHRSVYPLLFNIKAEWFDIISRIQAGVGDTTL